MCLCCSWHRSGNFNPLPPHGGRRIRPVVFGGVCIFQSTPSAWRETALTLHVQRGVAISIHSLRMEGDLACGLTADIKCDFNPLPPHGGKLPVSFCQKSTPEFQSTPSAWRETGAYKQFNVLLWTFQSTPSAWRETLENSFLKLLRIYFNPLPPHGGRLTYPFSSILNHLNFNPLPPHGGRQRVKENIPVIDHFNPLPPHGGRHIDLVDGDPAIIISIHSLRMEGDEMFPTIFSFISHFNPLPPHGGRLMKCIVLTFAHYISIHSLRMEGDLFPLRQDH